MYSYGPPHMAVQKQDDQHEHTFSNYVRIQDIVLKTCLRRWTIGKSGERGSGISVLPARHDDDDDIYIYILKFRWPHFDSKTGIWFAILSSLPFTPRFYSNHFTHHTHTHTHIYIYKERGERERERERCMYVYGDVGYDIQGPDNIFRTFRVP